MKKTYQLGGNARKELRCPACCDDFQHDIYHSQMLENPHGTVGSVEKFDNWAEDPEIKAVLCTMVEKCAQQLGLRLRSVPENVGQVDDPQADGQGDAGGGGDGLSPGNGTGSVSGQSTSTAISSVWELLEAGQSIVLESVAPPKDRGAEEPKHAEESSSSSSSSRRSEAVVAVTEAAVAVAAVRNSNLKREAESATQQQQDTLRDRVQ